MHVQITADMRARNQGRQPAVASRGNLVVSIADFRGNEGESEPRVELLFSRRMREVDTLLARQLRDRRDVRD